MDEVILEDIFETISLCDMVCTALASFILVQIGVTDDAVALMLQCLF